MKENLHQVFVDETVELLTTLEKGLLQLEDDASDPDGIGKVFRAMHTIKGTSGMFGFDFISELTHELETIFESIREGHSRLTQDILRVTFTSLDHLKALLSDHLMADESLREKHNALLLEIPKVGEAGKITEQANVASKANAKTTLYYILFLPFENILRNGTNPLFIIEDLLALGKGLSLPHNGKIPNLQELLPESNYTGFEILLETDRSEVEIRDVFMFVTSECELTIRPVPVSEGVLLESFRHKILNSHNPLLLLGYETICALISPETFSKEQIVEKKNNGISQFSKVNSKGSSIRVSSERLDELMNLVSELVTTQAQLSLFSNLSDSGELESISENVEKITRRLRDNAFSMSLIPVESLVVKFQRLVRDLSKGLNKDVVLVTEGAETEIDKSIMEKLSDPLLHLLRNSLDHGIEPPEERERKGKPRQGTVLLKAYYSGANVAIEISDDGAGINYEKVKNKAIEKGLIAADAAMSEREIQELIFQPGFSTAEQVTGISGRGVGMDVVRKNISDIRGEVEVSAQPGQGTKFTIILPLTLSIIDGLLVRIDSTDFILPLSVVDKCYEIRTGHLRESENKWVNLDGERTPFLFLREKFNIQKNEPMLSQIIKISNNGNQIGLAVDSIVGEYQAVIKPLGSMYNEQDEFSGATILGDGSVALVVDPNKLIKKLTYDNNLN